MEYKPEYMADYYADNEPTLFNVTQRITVLRTYTVEASSLSNAVAQIEEGDFTGVVAEDNTHAEEEKGRIVSATVNDYGN